MRPPTVLALGLANFPLIYGLAAASVPVVIHLLNRRKFREVRWAAMRFLVAAVRKNSRRVRVEQWLLLAVRTLVIVLAVTAMAKPFLEGLGAIPVIAGRRTHRVIVLDGSMSMATADAGGGATRFDRAKAVAAQLVKDARRGDAVSLVLLADPPKVVIGDPSPNHDEVLKELRDVAQTHGRADVVAGFIKLDQVLASSPLPQKEVVFLTDLQATTWRRPSGAADDGLRRALARVEARRPRTVVINLGKAGATNLAVTDLRTDAAVATAATPGLVRATVRNFGPGRRDGLGVRLVVDGNLGPSESVDLAAGEDRSLGFAPAYAGTGDHLVEVRIDDDALKPDDRRWLSVPVRDQVSVLLVDGHYKSEPFQSETDYLAVALSPESNSAGSPPSVVRTEVVPESQLARRELAGYDAVVLCNLAQFTDPEVNALEDYLRQGGGVVVFGGDQVVPENYNRLLHRGGKGLLPAAVGPAVGDAAKKESGFGFDPLGFRHPVVADFGAAGDAVKAGLTRTKTWQFHKLSVPEGSPARVALAFDNGDPAVVEAPRHRGTVIQVATSADAGWTTWPLRPSYPPVMESLVLAAASGRSAERNVRVGQPLDQALPSAGGSPSVSVVVPGGRSVALKLRPAGGVSLFHFEETELSGPYRVRVGPPLGVDSTFAANPDPAESDPAVLDRAGLAAAVPGWSFAYLTDWKGLTGDAAAVSRRGELHRPLLYALLFFLLFETFLAWRFGHHATRA